MRRNFLFVLLMSFIVSLAHVFKKPVRVRSTGLSLICFANQSGSSERIKSAGMSVSC
jgi:hypothetical protein